MTSIWRHGSTALCRSLFPMSWKALISATSFTFQMKISHSTASMSRKNQLPPLRKTRSRILWAIRYIWRTASRSLLRASAFLIFLSAIHRFAIPFPVWRAGRVLHGSWSGIRSRNRHPPTPRKPWRYIPVTKTTSPMMWRFALCALTNQSMTRPLRNLSSLNRPP